MDILIIAEITALVAGSIACVTGVFAWGYLYGQMKAFKEIGNEFDNFAISITDSVDEYTGKVDKIFKDMV